MRESAKITISETQKKWLDAQEKTNKANDKYRKENPLSKIIEKAKKAFN